MQRLLESQQSAFVVHLSSTWLHVAEDAHTPDAQKPAQQSMPDAQVCPVAAHLAYRVATGWYTPEEAS
jgi:hypothetical protein